ncbi:Cohesin subunit SA-3, partial [Zostera marina]
AYKRHMLDLSVGNELSFDKSFSECKDLATRLSTSFIGAARNKHKSHILQITKDGVAFAFEDIPMKLSFLEAAVLPFVYKLPTLDAIETLKYAKKMSNGINTDEDPSSWRPYHTFIDNLTEKYAKNELNQDDTELNIPRRHVRKRKTKKPKGRKLFQDSSDDDFISDSDESDHGNENDDDEQPIIHTFKSAAKFQSMKLSQQGKKDKVGSSKSAGGSG